jgi:hypothetical protein
MNINNFIAERPHLVWSTKKYDALSEGAILEAVLNYGSFTDVKVFFSLLGIKKSAAIFSEQIRRKRVNYSPKIQNYFTLYFKKYA